MILKKKKKKKKEEEDEEEEEEGEEEEEPPVCVACDAIITIKHNILIECANLVEVRSRDL